RRRCRTTARPLSALPGALARTRRAGLHRASGRHQPVHVSSRPRGQAAVPRAASAAARPSCELLARAAPDPACPAVPARDGAPLDDRRAAGAPGAPRRRRRAGRRGSSGYLAGVTRAYVGLGANLGDRSAMLRAALEQLDAEPGVFVVAVS